MALFFWDKHPIISACEKSAVQREQGWQNSFDEIYLLTHPYYGLSGNESYFQGYHSVLLQSIESVRARWLTALWILTLEWDEGYEFSKRNPVQKYAHEVLRKMQEIFWDKLHVRIQTNGYYEMEYHALLLNLSPKIVVSARWIWGSRCVLTTLEDFVHVHTIPENRAILAVSESLLPANDHFPIPESWAITIEQLRTLWKLRIGHPKK